MTNTIVFGKIVILSQNNGICTMSKYNIASQCGLAYNTVSDAIKDLIRCGLIVDGTPNSYISKTQVKFYKISIDGYNKMVQQNEEYRKFHPEAKIIRPVLTDTSNTDTSNTDTCTSTVEVHVETREQQNDKVNATTSTVDSDYISGCITTTSTVDDKEIINRLIIDKDKRELKETDERFLNIKDLNLDPDLILFNKDKISDLNIIDREYIYNKIATNYLYQEEPTMEQAKVEIKILASYYDDIRRKLFNQSGDRPYNNNEIDGMTKYEDVLELHAKMKIWVSMTLREVCRRW